MQIYLVGGAVRDQLLGLHIKERDWVVVGATEAEMLAQDFIKVGKDFPVFLHPETKEEYALARTERKTSKGYYGFECYAAPDVTLEQDLQRRDITINAMAQDSLGNIIDPFHGQEDIKNHVLRHVSPAFSEDPVRILRVARFAARFADLGFFVADETISLMRQMVINGEVDALVPERVWQEWQRSLTAMHPEVFLTVLNESGTLAKLFPEIQNELEETLILLQQTSVRTPDPIIRFTATMLYVNPLDAFCQRYRIPNEYREIAVLIQKYHKNILQTLTISANDVLALLTKLDAWRRPERLQQVLHACLILFPEGKSAIERLQQAHEITTTVKAAEFIEQGLQGADIQNAMQAKRLALLQDL